MQEVYRRRYYQPSYASRVVIDGTPILRNLIQARLPESGIVVDVGAGDGRGLDHPCRRPGITLIGIDRSEDVKLNEHLDDYVIQSAESMPFETNSIDAVFSDFTIEHLEEPNKVIDEIARVLKPRGALVFRTVNALHYVALCASLLSGKFRSKALTIAGRSPEEAFPTYYRLNTKVAIFRTLERSAFDVEEFIHVEGPPDYLSFSSPLYRLGVLYERLANRTDRGKFLRANMIVAARKRAALSHPR